MTNILSYISYLSNPAEKNRGKKEEIFAEEYYRVDNPSDNQLFHVARDKKALGKVITNLH